MSKFKQYRRKSVSEMTPWVEGFDMERVSVSQADQENGSPKVGDMIARNPKDHNDQWLVAEAYFNDNLEPITLLDKILGSNEVEGEPDRQPTWKERVINEKDALTTKTNALEKFISTEQFRALRMSDKVDLKAQLKYMTKYLDVLLRRINKF